MPLSPKQVRFFDVVHKIASDYAGSSGVQTAGDGIENEAASAEFTRAEADVIRRIADGDITALGYDEHNREVIVDQMTWRKASSDSPFPKVNFPTLVYDADDYGVTDLQCGGQIWKDIRFWARDAERVFSQYALSERKNFSTKRAEKECEHWLKSLMIQNPESSPKPKPMLREEAKAAIANLSTRGFDRAYERARAAVPHASWSRGGRPRGRSANPNGSNPGGNR